MIIAGLITLFSLDIPVFRVRSLETASQSRDTAWAVYLLGITYGIAGVGCAGPILGAVLATSSLGGSVLEGVIAVIFYSAGMAFPSWFSHYSGSIPRGVSRRSCVQNP